MKTPCLGSKQKATGISYTRRLEIGTCPSCGAWCRVTKAGTVYAHRDTRPRPTLSDQEKK